jgi:hypothetical protein
LIAEAATAEREARSAWRVAEMLDTRETWLAAAEAAQEARIAAEQAEWPLVVDAAIAAERDARARAEQRGSQAGLEDRQTG